MPHPNSEVDANFYAMIHSLAEAEKAESVERRRALRRPYPTCQRIAPRQGPEFPEADAFFDVRCYDLNGAGFSFLLPTPPTFDTLVAAFGSPPKTVYVAARVVYHKRVLFYPSGLLDDSEEAAENQPAAVGADRPQPRILVGCRFTEKLAGPDQSKAANGSAENGDDAPP